MTAQRFLLLGLFVVSGVSFCYGIQDFDTFMHLASGRVILETGSIPRTDCFSHSAADHRWVNHQWLAQVFLFSLYRQFDTAGVVLLKVAVGLLAVLGLDRLTAWSGLGTEARVPALCLVVFALRSRLSGRPEMFTILLLTVTMLLVQRYDHRRERWPLVVLALLFPLWVNLHAGFPAGVLYVGLWCLGGVLAEGVVPWLRGGEIGVKRLQRSLLPLGSCLVGLLLALSNPLGLDALLYPVDLIGETVFMRRIQEWMPPEFALPFWPFWTLFGLCWLFALRYPRELRWQEALPAAVFMAMAFGSRRHVALFALVAMVPLARLVRVVGEEVRTWKPHLSERAGQALAGAVLVAGSLHLAADDQFEFGLGRRFEAYPVEVTAWLEEVDHPARLVNPYEWGGYLLYHLAPTYRVFMDGRCLVYGGEVVRDYEAILVGRENIGALLDDYNVTMVVTDYAHDYDPVSGLQDYCAVRPEWRLVYFGPKAMVYARDTPQNADLIATYGYRIIDPNRRSLDYVQQMGRLDDAIADLEENLRRDPDNTRAGNLLAIAYGLNGDYERCLAQVNATLRHAPDSVDARNTRGYFSAIQGRLDAAEAAYREAVAIAPTNVRARQGLGEVLQQQGRYAEAIEQFQTILQVQPGHGAAALLLAGVHVDQGASEAALAALERFVARNPDQLDVRSEYGVLLASEGRLEEAVHTWESCLLRDPTHGPAQKYLQRAYQQLQGS